MVPSREEYYNLVKKFETQYEESPTRYKLQLFWIAAGGYAFVIGACLLNALMLWGLVAYHLKNGFSFWLVGGYAIAGLTLWATIRSLLFRIPLPDGVELKQDDFPYIHQEIKALRRPLKLRWKKVRVILNWEFNAAAINRPMLGILGPSRYYLSIGLPILAISSTEDLRAILAHELAHLSRKHSHSTVWLGRLKLTWLALLARLQSIPISGFVFRKFAEWYAAYFEAATVVLSREHEYEADKLAAEAIGSNHAARAHLRVAMRGEIVEEYWESLFRRALSAPEPADNAVSKLVNLLAKPLDKEKTLRSLRWHLGAGTQFYDTHPALPDRLKAIGISLPSEEGEIEPFIAKHGICTPAQTIRKALGKAGDDTEKFMDAVWSAINEIPWRIRNLEGQPIADMIREIEAEYRDNGTITVEKAWKRAALTVECHGVEPAIPYVDFVLKRNPDHPGANMVRGCRLLREYDAEGILYVEKAIELDPLGNRVEGLEALSDFYRRMGSHDEAEAAKKESFTAGDETDKALHERSMPISASDTFLPHDLSLDEAQDIQATLRNVHQVKKVYVVRKKVKHVRDTPFYVIGIEPTLKGRLRPRSTFENVLRQMAFSKSHTVIVVRFEAFRMKRALSRVNSSRIL